MNNKDEFWDPKMRTFPSVEESLRLMQGNPITSLILCILGVPQGSPLEKEILLSKGEEIVQEPSFQLESSTIVTGVQMSLFG